MTDSTSFDGLGQEAHSEVRIQVVRDVRDLEALTSPWKALAKEAADSNVFYEPWILLPSLRYLHAGRDLLFLFMKGTPNHGSPRFWIWNPVWVDRRTIETLLVSPNRAWGNFIVAGYPLLRWIKLAARPNGGKRNP